MRLLRPGELKIKILDELPSPLPLRPRETPTSTPARPSC